MELQLTELRPVPGEPLYQALARSLRVALQELPAHSRLPSIRRLARDLAVNPATVVAALQQLETAGLIYCRPGSGCYLAPVSDTNPAAVQPASAPAVSAQIDFASGSPSPEYFPIDQFKQAFDAVLDRDRGQAFLYPDPTGYLPLRLSIADYLRANGIQAAAEQVQITSGAQQAISLLCQTLIRPGDTACIESPTYPGAMQALHAVGARLVAIPIGQQGPAARDLQLVAKCRPRLYYAIPNFQNPTGICYSQQARNQLIDLARRSDFYIIEDDHVSELYFTGSRPCSLWQQAPDRVLYVKSFSKLFMPGLRLGFMLLPTELQQQVSQAKHAADLGSPGIIQRVLDVYLRSGHWQEYQDFLRRTYRDRAQVMQQALRRGLGRLASCLAPRGGMNFWLSLPTAVSGDRLQAACAAAGLLISPGREFSPPDRSYRQSVRLSIAAAFPDQIERGVELLTGCLEQLLQ